MQVSVETTSGLERKMTVQVPASEVDQEVEKRLQKVGRTAKIKGFRPGKVPMKVLRQQYGEQVRQEVLGDVVQSSFSQAVVKQELNPAGGPQIQFGANQQGKDLEYTAVFEVYPEVSFGPLEKIKVERPVAEITDADLDGMIDNLRRQRLVWDDVERAARDGDRLTVDFEGTLDGVPFDGGKADDFVVTLGEGRMLEDFEKGLSGMKAGESKEVKVSFPADYHAEDLKGKEAVFTISAKKVEQSRLPELDEEFVKSFGVDEGGVEAFKAEVRGNMEQEMAQAVKARLRESVLDALAENNEVDLPKALVHREIHQLQHDAGRRMGITDHSKLPPAEPFEEPARKRVKLGLLIGELIRQNGLELDRSRVEQKLDELTSTYGEREKMLSMYRSNAQAMAQVESMVMEEQVVEWLLEQVKVSDKQTSFKELMKLGEK